MLTKKFRVEHARPKDAAVIADLARKSFHDAFLVKGRSLDMNTYLNANFSLNIQLKEILDPERSTLLLYHAATPVGFAQLYPSKLPKCVQGYPNPLELARFYLDFKWHGTGGAKELGEACIAVAKQRGYRAIWGGVWEENKRALSFYGKWDFEKVGSHVFMLGTDAQTDHLLVKRL